MLSTKAEGKPTAYLAGPMSGLPNYNFDEFARLSRVLRDRGFAVVNPAETAGGDQSLGRAWYFRYDFGAIMGVCDLVLAMPGWDQSEGAKAEVAVANEIGIPVGQLDEAGNVVGEIIVTSLDLKYDVRGA